MLERSFSRDIKAQKAQMASTLETYQLQMTQFKNTMGTHQPRMIQALSAIKAQQLQMVHLRNTMEPQQSELPVCRHGGCSWQNTATFTTTISRPFKVFFNFDTGPGIDYILELKSDSNIAFGSKHNGHYRGDFGGVNSDYVRVGYWHLERVEDGIASIITSGTDQVQLRIRLKIDARHDYVIRPGNSGSGGRFQSIDDRRMIENAITRSQSNFNKAIRNR
ncbi:hypothetical protein BGZ96_003181 [Linnemannia gamsii]|uniref:Uncharacterized protein n=1 Tax=Linnemannia gamsii TaxID=64522 RepID=A0ABQ7K771_9FUNG|nr:hypothetical protein BGZ96_003181 [Linnemannia gamsii]